VGGKVIVEGVPVSAGETRPRVCAYGITAIMAPTIGPTLGGWITDNYSWRWIFFINFPVGALATWLVIHLVEDPPYLRRMARGGVGVDYIGISLLVLGVGAL